MKKNLLMSGMAALAFFNAAAQKIDAAKVPAVVKKSFEKKYPSITPNGKWKMENMKPVLNKAAHPFLF